ncbi:hypothetical protein ACIBO5_50370 [Nonomuraea angiospora]|uniref:hypothetical protein n=1 Tax=Nonomuraea angiospora TaxID=46172 RepID=UPI0037A6AC4F
MEPIGACTVLADPNSSGLLVPSAQTGVGATAVDALRVQRALGSRSPSLAVATTTHHFSIGTLIGLVPYDENPDFGWAADFLKCTADENVLVASSFAEERLDAGILSSSLTATEEEYPEGVLVSGMTRPYGLARVMDLLLADVMVSRVEGQGEERALVMVNTSSEGVSGTSYNPGTGQSGQVTFDDVPVESWVWASNIDKPVDVLLTAGFTWFQLLMTGSYLGAASALVERVLLDNRMPETERIRLLMEVERAMLAAEGVARRIDDGGGADESTLADSLYVRYGVQDTLSRVVPRAVELLGDLESTAAEEVGYLATYADGLAQYPPAPSQMTGPLAAYLADGPLTIA